MLNVGAEIEKKLKAVGIGSAEDLKDAGSKGAFLRLKARFPNVCLVHLYALEGAISGISHEQLPGSVKRDLREYNDGLKQ